jgi:hypothetical protein
MKSTSLLKRCHSMGRKNRNRVPEGSRSRSGRHEVDLDAGNHVKVPARINRPCAALLAVRLASRDGCNSTCRQNANLIPGAMVKIYLCIYIYIYIYKSWYINIYV